MIKANDVSLIYQDGTKALRNVNLDIKAGELVYITGPSGSGKTSLLKMIMGMEYPTAGNIMVFDNLVKKNNSGNIRKIRKRI
ncbi:MAG: ATP-binding cassette domain-containing protein, partial [Bacteroidales bacterium]|nr:ATP-binding cassette domain-containing protein [Bacteroidales bacterium]